MSLDKEPDRATRDFTDTSYGSHRYEIDIYAWTYSGVKNEDVYVKNNTFVVRATSFKEACSIAEIIRRTIQEVRDIYGTGITRVAVSDA